MKNFTARNIAVFTLLTSGFLNQSFAAPDGFNKGPVFENFGENIVIEGGLDNAKQQKFKVLFDVYKENKIEKPHRGFNSIARFINMHVRAGVALENIDIALVIHGKASYDLMSNKAFEEKFGKENPSSKLLNQFLSNNVKIFVCGQSSSFLGLKASQFNDRVKVSLSAMTSNALLQQNGYTLNPF